MIIESRLPDPALQHLIRECYYFSTGPGSESKFVPVIDDGCYDFVFFREQDSTLTWGPRQIQVPIPFKAFTIHQLRPPYAIRFGKSLTFFTIKVQPWANALFFGSLPHTGVVDLMPWYPGVEKAYRALMSEGTLDERFAAAGQFIRGQDRELSPSALLVKELCEAIYDTRGMTSVLALSEAFGRSRQYLGKVFRQEALYSLKQFIRMVRIMDLVKFRIRHPDLSMTELCYRYDYFDQPHFNRDFKRVCGVTPTRFFAHLPEFLLRH